MKEFTIGTNDAGQRLDRFLAKAVPLLPASLAQKYIRIKRIKLNNARADRDTRLQTGDVLQLYINDEFFDKPREDNAYLTVATPKLNIVYEDDHILLVDKPVGMLIHPSRSQNTGTLANLVAGYYAKTNQNCAFHPMTRLDRDTFGIVLLAKHSHAHSLLQAGSLQKTYHALTLGGPEEDQGIIDAPIARRPLPSLLRYVNREGKPSLTQYRVLERRNELCKLELRPITGRTHQLRVHCAHMGFPILGDPQYGTEESVALSEKLGLTGQLLCAKALEFHHPMTDQPLRVESRLEVNIWEELK